MDLELGNAFLEQQDFTTDEAFLLLYFHIVCCIFYQL